MQTNNKNNNNNNNNLNNSRSNNNKIKLVPIIENNNKPSSTKNRLFDAKNYSNTLNTLYQKNNIAPPTTCKTAGELSKGFVVKIISDVLATKQ